MTEDSLIPKTDDPKKILARELWTRFVKSRPGSTIEEFLFLARFDPAFSKSAVKTLGTRKLGIEELKERIQHVPKAKEAAVKIALRQFGDDLSEEDLRFLFTHSRSVDAGGNFAQAFSK